MEQLLYCIFWICLGTIFYNYIGYGLILAIIVRVKRLLYPQKHLGYVKSKFPPVTLIVAAYNEEDVIREKIANCQALNYPKNKLTFLFVTDGSDDKTADIIREYPFIQLLDGAERKGKTAALNRAMAYVATPITIFCDANTILNRSAIQRIVRHYEDPKTGGVAGEKRIITEGNAGTPAAGEGLYWKYESWLKQLDAALYTVTGAAGELFSIRTKLWTPMPENVILDDFVISTRVNLQGFRIAYEPNAYATELPSASLKEEKKRKIRISAGAFQAMGMVKPIFNIFRHPVLFFQFFSHRFLRWTLTPLSFPLLLLANSILVAFGAGIFYKIVLIGQISFYLLAFAGAYLAASSPKFKALKIFHYIFFMNYSVYLGFFRYLGGNQSGVWEKAQREILIQA